MSDAYLEDLKAFIIQAVKDGHDIDEIILNQHWTEAFLAKFDVIINDEFVADALKEVWVDMAAGKTSHAKKYAYFDPNELGNSDGAMVGHYGNVTGSKVITFRKDNASKGLPGSFCDAMLRALSDGKRFFTCEAITASDKRTGWFALAMHNIATSGRTGVVGFLVGNGAVGVSCLDFLNLSAPGTYTVFNVCARDNEKNKKIVADIAPRMKFPLEAVDDHTALRTSGFLITAASGDVPVVATADVPDDCHILSQGRNDLPADLIKKRIEDPKCLIVSDNFKAMEERDVDPLAKYQSAKGEKLAEVAKKNPNKYLEYASIITNPLAMELLKNWTGTFLFLPVGLFAYDAAVVVKMHATLKANILDIASAQLERLV